MIGNPSSQIPSIRHIYKLLCQHCKSLVCVRGMKAILLANNRIDLYSTDVPSSSICVLYRHYLKDTCQCRIQDTACLECGNILGYHIISPCLSCLNASHNGHLWMFRSEECDTIERYDINQKLMYWPNAPKIEIDLELKTESYISHHLLYR
ncbi:uncharacterized protein BX663DRAFT_424925 [Cokeromyces recurvatus]|uniref:uncharacterized protein n=1 Tax=Cokeromyces recurvatus TaxID=90255 RepID=UPI00221F031C|nr:uncharacterized protein BX663DRAFT_424925 [Cokeromyces recurvatus]KAI7907954.1 hypothetical protein BX663DRAFT_424925 [Cokeromyces recurvatus]